MNIKTDTNLQVKEHILNSPVYRGGNSIKMVKAAYGLEDIIKLASNENPLPTNPRVIEAISEAVKKLNRYPINNDRELRQKLSDYVGHGLQPEQFIVANGGCDVLSLIARAFLSAGDEAIICPPTFPVYEITIKQAGATAVYADRNADYSYNVENILTAVTPKTRVIYLCSPNNPTGSILSQEQLDTLLEKLPDDILIVADEVYWQFNTNDLMADSIQKVNDLQNIIVVHSFSKVFGLAGLRLGYGISTPAIIDYLRRAKLPFHLDHLSMTAAFAALDDLAFVEEVAMMTIRERQHLFEQLQKLDGVQVFESEANFLLIKPETDSHSLTEALKKEGMIIRELSGFYMPGFCRISIGLPEENRQFLDLLAKHL